MTTLQDKLRAFNQRIQTSDEELAGELGQLNKKLKPVPEGFQVSPQLEGRFSPPMASDLETIVLRTVRPVLTIADNAAVLDFRDAESEVWRARLLGVQAELTAAVRSVGRIDLTGDPNLDWVGTGWVVAEGVIVTNRHVAQVFASRQGRDFVFRLAVVVGRVSAAVDFLQEAGSNAILSYPVASVLYIADADGPDLAFMRLEKPEGQTLPAPIPLAEQGAKDGDQVAAIGYPARDSRILEQGLMEKIFGDIYNKKRLAPGLITGTDGDTLYHDCSTLGGNSGSVLIDLKTGKAVGLHFAGRFLESNYAVPAAVVKAHLTGWQENKPAEPDPPRPAADQAASWTIDVPLRITVSAGGYQLTASTLNADGFAPDDVSEAARPEDYSDRTGYQTGFLGPACEVRLPEFTDANRDDVLHFQENGKDAYLLKYTHFSLAMSKQRRQCFFSAVNIDGKTSFPQPRKGWKTDPRIPAGAQIIAECYGNAPKFARGHMTRREDPIWGMTDEGTLGNADSMHVTNTVPQMQTMNGGIWLDLENYALKNARKDQMKISVMTGPFFADSDPVKFGIIIPIAFWKIIVFIHEQTGKLCATGYTLSQKDDITEIVYGQHGTAQIAISEIQRRTQLDLSHLVAIDPLAATEGPEQVSLPLSELKDIRFV